MITAALQRVADMMDAGDIDASPVLHVGAIERVAETLREDAPLEGRAVLAEGEERSGAS